MKTDSLGRIPHPSIFHEHPRSIWIESGELSVPILHFVSVHLAGSTFDLPPAMGGVEMWRGGLSHGQRVTMFSPSFLVHIDGEKEDLLELAVHGRHYDSPTTQLLALGEDEWNMLRALSARNDRKLFLGPTLYELLHGHRDSVWVVREVAVQSGDADGLSWELIQGDEPAVVVLDLGTAVDEELYSLQAAQQRIALTDGWQDLFPIQLGRRLAYEG